MKRTLTLIPLRVIAGLVGCAVLFAGFLALEEYRPEAVERADFSAGTRRLDRGFQFPIVLGARLQTPFEALF